MNHIVWKEMIERTDRGVETPRFCISDIRVEHWITSTYGTSASDIRVEYRNTSTYGTCASNLHFWVRIQGSSPS